jgi:hypothetical protein
MLYLGIAIFIVSQVLCFSSAPLGICMIVGGIGGALIGSALARSK